LQHEKVGVFPLDVKPTFLNGVFFEEEIYIEQPQGFISKGNEAIKC